MKSCLAVLAVLVLAVPAFTGGTSSLSGQYVEARTCDVWTGACFANAEMHLTGKHAVMAWKFDQGVFNGVDLKGLSVVAVVEATDTLGTKQTGPSKAVLLLDEKANSSQREALLNVAKKLGGDLLKNVVAIEKAPIAVEVNHCSEGGCARVDAKLAKVETRCLHAEEDSVCGHEDNFYPPLTKGLKVKSAMVKEHSFTGNTFNKTWNDAMRRGAYIGTFSVTE